MVASWAINSHFSAMVVDRPKIENQPLRGLSLMILSSHILPLLMLVPTYSIVTVEQAVAHMERRVLERIRSWPDRGLGDTF
jgi:hypothetical protein